MLNAPKKPAGTARQAIMDDPDLKQVFGFWCNMLMHWQPVHLSGISTIDQLEMCVEHAMVDFAHRATKYDNKAGLYINPMRPVQYVMFLGKEVVSQEISNLPKIIVK